jgi:hypothetical protein
MGQAPLTVAGSGRNMSDCGMEGFLAEDDHAVSAPRYGTCDLEHEYPIREDYAAVDGLKTDEEWECFLGNRTQAKKGRELRWNKMTPDQQQLFTEAMHKEWSGWLANNVCDVIPPSRARRVPGHLRIPTRFIFTDKNEMLRSS